MKITLQRTKGTGEVTLGELLREDGQRLCYTLELPWKQNKPRISCIPPGMYAVGPHDTPKFPDTWEVRDVPDRQAILIHAGNTVNDIEGCILVGLERGQLNGLPAVLRSKAAMKMLHSILPEFFTLIVAGNP